MLALFGSLLIECFAPQEKKKSERKYLNYSLCVIISAHVPLEKKKQSPRTKAMIDTQTQWIVGRIKQILWGRTLNMGCPFESQADLSHDQEQGEQTSESLCLWCLVHATL